MTPERHAIGTDPVLDIRNASVRFGGVEAVREVSFQLRGGEVVGLIGPNGAGKSSVLGGLGGQFALTSGRVLLCGHDVTSLPPHRRARLGLVRTFQHTSTFNGLTVFENLLPVFVADTDARAEAIALPALDTLFNKLMRMPRDVFFPAGYLTLASAARVMAGKGGLGSGQADVRDLVERGYAVIGSADTVRQKMEAYQAELGFGTFCGVFQFGSLGHEDFTESLRLFADKVLPSLRALP
jgi:ABC-type Fe3+/spermidine/putrescine transport system ATPase subunit